MSRRVIGGGGGGGGAGRGRGAASATAAAAAPELERTMGALGATFQTTSNVDHASRMQRLVTRHAIYAQEEEDYDAEQHRPTEDRLAALASTRLTSDALYENPYAEAEEHIVEPPAEEIAQFRADLHSARFVATAQSRTLAADVGAERLRRAAIATKSRHNASIVTREMQRRPQTELDRVAAEVRRADEAVIGSLVPPRTSTTSATTIATADSSRASLRLITQGDAVNMLHVDCLRGLPPSVKSGFTGLQCVSNLLCYLQPELYVHEPDRQHYSSIELIETLVSAGAKFESATRFVCRARLCTLVDREFYAPFLRLEKATNKPLELLGGHEHYDGSRRETRFVAFTFRCVRRTKENNTDGRSSEAARELRRVAAEARERRPGVDVLESAEAERQNARQQQQPYPIRHAAYADPWADTFTGDDEDDKYEGGNDIKVPSRHYLYRLDVVCVEATDCVHVDETRRGQPIAPTPPQSTALPTTRHGANDDDDDVDDDIFGSPRRHHTLAPDPTAAAATASTRDPLADLMHLDDGTGTDAKLHQEMMPSGTCRVSYDRAVKLVGRWKAPQLLTLLNSTDRVGPLCVRSFAFASDTIH